MMEIITKNTGGRVLAREEIIDGCTVQHYKCGCNTGVKTYHLLSLNYRKDPRFVRIYNNYFSKDILLQYSAGLVDINSMRSLLEKVTNMGRFFGGVTGTSLVAYSVTSVWATTWSKTRSLALAGLVGGGFASLCNLYRYFDVQTKIENMIPKLRLIASSIYPGASNQEEAREALALYLIKEGVTTLNNPTDQEVADFVKTEWHNYFTYTCTSTLYNFMINSLALVDHKIGQENFGCFPPFAA